MSAVILLITFLLFFMPVSVTARLFFDKARKKLYFGVYLYSALRVIGGSIEPQKTKAIVRIGKKKKEAEYKNLLENKMDLNLFYGFTFTEISILTETGSEKDKFAPMIAALIGNVLGSVALSVIKTLDPALKAYCGAEIREGEDLFKVNANAGILVNFALVTILLIKMILEKMINGKRRSQ